MVYNLTDQICFKNNSVYVKQCEQWKRNIESVYCGGNGMRFIRMKFLTCAWIQFPWLDESLMG